MSSWPRRLWTLTKIGAAVAAVVAAFVLWPKEYVDVTVVHLQQGDVADVVTTTQAGVVKAARYARVRSTTMGAVDRIPFKKGDRVKAGAVVVQLESRESRARLDLARANLAAGLAAKRQLELRTDAAGRAFDRTKKLFDGNYTSAASLEQVQTEKDISEQMVTAADSNLLQLKAAVDIATAAVDNSVFRAPFDGVLVAITPVVGESVSPGTPVYELVDDTRLTIEAAVDEVDAARLQLGMPVAVTTDALPGAAMQGHLSWIAPVVTQDLRGGRTVDITVELAQPEPSLKVGLSVDLEIRVATRQAVAHLPTSAIIGKGTRQKVLVVDGLFAREREVRTGLSNWESTEIVSGLTAADQVISSLNARGLSAGSRVKIKNPLATTAATP